MVTSKNKLCMQRRKQLTFNNQFHRLFIVIIIQDSVHLLFLMHSIVYAIYTDGVSCLLEN